MIDAIATPRNGRDNDHTQYITYTVTPEDEEQCRSVAAFALRSDLDVNEFMAMNALRMDDNLYAGQVCVQVLFICSLQQSLYCIC